MYFQHFTNIYCIAFQEPNYVCFILDTQLKHVIENERRKLIVLC